MLKQGWGGWVGRATTVSGKEWGILPKGSKRPRSEENKPQGIRTCNEKGGGKPFAE